MPRHEQYSSFASQDQKIPKPKRLQDWYKKMLDKGIIERIVLDYKDIYKQALEDNLQSPAELPYFEGDFWPNVLEENIREVEQVRYRLPGHVQSSGREKENYELNIELINCSWNSF